MRSQPMLITHRFLQRLAACLWVWWLAAGAIAAEPEPTKPDIARARALFSEATRLRDAGRWSAAAEKLRQAIAIKETPGLRFHLAHCEERLGQLVEAETDYNRAQALIESGASAPDVAELLAAARSELGGRIPTLSIRLEAPTGNEHVSLDGQDVEQNRLSKPQSVNPGKHVVVVEAEGHSTFRSELSLTEGEDRVVRVDLPAFANRAPAAAEPRENSVVSVAANQSSRPHLRHVGWGAREWVLTAEGLLTVAGLAAGVVLELNHGYADNNVQDYRDRIDADLGGTRTSNEECANPGTRYVDACAAIDSANGRSERYAKFAIVSFVGAGVGAAAFASTWFFWPTAGNGAAANVQFSAFPGGIAARGTF